MSRMKNGGKRGFVRLKNEDSVMMNDSGSEVELLDITEMNLPNGKLEHSKRRNRSSSGGDGCCCGCCVSFYLFLLTVLLVILTIFNLFLAYDLKLMKVKFEELSVELDGIKKDYTVMAASHQEESRNLTTWKNTQAAKLANHTFLLAVIHTTEEQYKNQLKTLSNEMNNNTAEIATIKKATSQLDAKQMERVNASLAVVSSFTSEVSGIHTSMAQLGGRMDGLSNEVTSTKKYCSDFGTKIETLTETVGDIQDTVSVMKSGNAERESAVDFKLASISYLIGNHTQSVTEMFEMFNHSLLVHIESVAQVAREDMRQLEAESRELKQTVDDIINELRNGTFSLPQEGSKGEDKGSEAENKGSGDADQGSKDLNKGPEDESKDVDKGSEDENKGSEDENQGSEDENQGSEDENQGSKDENQGSKDENKGSEDEDTGSKDENKGSEDEDTGSKVVDKGSRPNNSTPVDIGSNDGGSNGGPMPNDTSAWSQPGSVNGSQTITSGHKGDDNHQSSESTSESIGEGDNPLPSNSTSKTYPDAVPESTQGTEPVPPIGDEVSSSVTDGINTDSAPLNSSSSPTSSSPSNSSSTRLNDDSSTTPPVNLPDPYGDSYPDPPTYDGENMGMADDVGVADDVGGDDQSSKQPADDKAASLKKFLDMFDDVDTDFDDKISYEEFSTRFHQHTGVFHYLDLNADGLITRQEVVTAIDNVTTPTNNHQATPPHYE